MFVTICMYRSSGDQSSELKMKIENRRVALFYDNLKIKLFNMQRDTFACPILNLGTMLLIPNYYIIYT